MTIPQHLQFSVLTAPLAAVDRRSLSQAWYSALYAQSAPPQKAVAMNRAAVGEEMQPGGRERSTENGARTAAFRNAAGLKAGVKTAVAGGELAERRARRSPLARKIERTFLQPGRRLHKAAFELENGAGRVQILLSGEGARINLIALCPRGATTQVSAALAQARYALARRGIALDAQTRERVSC